jgi:hypothetical protein
MISATSFCTKALFAIRLIADDCSHVNDSPSYMHGSFGDRRATGDLHHEIPEEIAAEIGSLLATL